MITAKQVLKLSEDWFKNIPGFKNQSVPVFINPTSSDLIELYQSTKKSNNSGLIRFIASPKDQNLYVWDAYLLVHTQVPSSLVVKGNISFYGIGVLSSGKIKYKVSHDSQPSTDINRLIEYTKTNDSDEYKIRSFGKYVHQDFDSLRRFYSYSWGFLTRVISGTDSFLLHEYNRLLSWYKKYGKLFQLPNLQGFKI